MFLNKDMTAAPTKPFGLWFLLLVYPQTIETLLIISLNTEYPKLAITIPSCVGHSVLQLLHIFIMWLRRALFFLFAPVPFAFGDVSFTIPSTAGDSFPGGSPFTVQWADSGAPPSISDLTTYQLALYTGSNAVPVRITSIA